MRKIERSNQFKRDLKREKKGRFSKKLADRLNAILALLAADKPLPQEYQDHALTGNLAGFRCCHVFNDNLCLVYAIGIQGVLWLARLGSHQEVGLVR